MASTRLIAGLFTAALAAGTGVVAQGRLSRYGLNDAQSKEIVMSAVEGVYSLGSVAKSFLGLAPAARAGAINDAVAWAKAYLNSSAFNQAWTAEREKGSPAPPEVEGTVDDEVKQEIADQLAQAAEMRKVLGTMPADQRPQMEKLIKEMEDRAKDPAAAATIRQNVANRRAEDQERYPADFKKWQEERPADPKTLIATRLQDFLTTCKDVNFDAKLETREGRRVFVDEEYEQKSNFWKMCYRAGREANTGARVAAAAWLKEMGR